MKKITKIEPQKRHKNRFNLYVDDAFLMGVDEDVIIKYSLSVDKEVNDEFIESVIKAEENSKAFNCAANLLSFKARSAGEIISKLKQKGYEDSSINYAIEKLKEYKYIDDYSFGKAFVKDRQYFKKAGKGLIQQELFLKGIDRETIEQLLEENVDEQEEYQRALELAEKKFKSFSSKDDKNARYRKLMGLLSRKGFDFDIISRVINEVINRGDIN